jgi:hypothetical protein
MVQPTQCRAVARSGNPMLLSMPVTFTKSNTIKDDGRSGSAGASGKARHRDAPCLAPRGWKARPLRAAASRTHCPLPPRTRTPRDLASSARQAGPSLGLASLAQVELETGSGLPEFVKEEFDAFLDCGILARGFLRLRCADCAHEKLVAFSCKRRGFCPSCGARRMAETAAHLADHVIPGCRCAEQLQTLLAHIITRLMNRMHRDVQL